MIKKFDTESAYAAAGDPNDESRVAEIAETNAVKIDGVNVVVDTPQIGDAVYKKDGERYIFRGGDALQHALLTAKGFEGLGQVAGWQKGKIVYLDKDISSAKYLDVCQYAITEISSTSLVISLRMSPDYAVNTNVNVALVDTSINAANAAAISAAVAAKAAEVGDTKDWWAYLDGDRIIIQCDTCVDYRFYIVSATGCTISHVTWEDMPASDSYFKSNGRLTNYRGLQNIARGAAYWGTNGRAEAGANDVWHGAIGANDNPLTRAAFLTTAMFGTGTHQYPTYEAYLKGEFGIMENQVFGCFALPHAKVLTQKYGNSTAPTKGGGTKYKFPALHYAVALDRGVEGLEAGDIYLSGVLEGTGFMEDDAMAIINATRRKMGHTLLSNGSYRWFAERYNVNTAWIFNGNNGTLNNSNVYNAYQVQGVALLNP